MTNWSELRPGDRISVCRDFGPPDGWLPGDGVVIVALPGLARYWSPGAYRLAEVSVAAKGALLGLGITVGRAVRSVLIAGHTRGTVLPEWADPDYPVPLRVPVRVVWADSDDGQVCGIDDFLLPHGVSRALVAQARRRWARPISRTQLAHDVRDWWQILETTGHQPPVLAAGAPQPLGSGDVVTSPDLPMRRDRAVFVTKRQVTKAHVRLDAACLEVPAVSPLIVTIKPKGGGAGTTTASGLLWAVGMRDRMPGLIVGADFDSTGGSLAARMGLTRIRATRRLYELPDAAEAIRYPADLAPWLDRVGRIHIVHNGGVDTSVLDQLSQAHWASVLDVLSRWTSLRLVDLGASVVNAPARAALAAADHLMVASTTDPVALNETAERLGELDRLGFGSLLAEATVVVSENAPGTPRQVYQAGLDYFRARSEYVALVGYDPAVRASQHAGAPRWDKVSRATELAYTRLATHVMDALARRIAATFQPASSPVTANSPANYVAAEPPDTAGPDDTTDSWPDWIVAQP